MAVAGHTSRLAGNALALRNPARTGGPILFRQKQHDFIFSPSRNTFLASGWAGGKTVAGAGYCYLSAIINSGTPGMVVMPTYRMQRNFLHRVLYPMMRDFIVGYSAQDATLNLKNGSSIIFLSGHNVESIEAYTVSWAYADEASMMDGQLLMRLNSRIRHPDAVRPRVGFTGTPRWGWVKDEFEGRKDADRYILHMSTRENLVNLPVGYLEGLLASCPARLAKSYIDGLFVPPGGMVYSMFDPDVHVVPWAYRRDLPTVPVIDWSARTPHVLFAQLLPQDTVLGRYRLRKLVSGHDWAGAIVFDELVPDGRYGFTREQLLQQIVGRGYRLDHFTCDPAGDAIQSATTISDVRRAREVLGIRARNPRGPERSIQAGIDHVQTMLMPASDQVPRLFFSSSMVAAIPSLPETCRGRASINAIMGYGYPSDQTTSVPVKDGITDHFCDCLRYLVVTHFQMDRLRTVVHVPQRRVA